jgi:alkylation response protein AidB-like acyl-CoA dehydrogenase
VDFDFSDVQLAWRAKAEGLGRELAADAAAADVVMGAARLGLIDRSAELRLIAVAVEALAAESPSAAVVLALHAVALPAIDREEQIGAVTLSTELVPALNGERLTGQVSWIGPLTDFGVGIVAGRAGESLVACAVHLDAPGVTLTPIRTAALRGVVFGSAAFDGVACTVIGSTLPIMARVRVLLSAAGLGMGRRALREGLAALRAQEGRPQGAGGEQTVQGLLADAATELEAASMLMWNAAVRGEPSLAEASMAKLAATEATQRAVARATQVVGADSFTSGHIVERLAQDVRALELFAGRTEALREAIAADVLPREVLPA